MRVLIDCMSLRSGGGLQVATAFLVGLYQQSDILWCAVMPISLFQDLPADVVNAGEIYTIRKKTKFDFLRARQLLKSAELEFKPDVVFSVFGPSYFRSRAPQLTGFALPNLIYPLDGILATTNNIKSRLLDKFRIHLLKTADQIVVETETVRNLFSSQHNYPIERIAVIPNCVNPVLASLPITSRRNEGPFRILVPSTWYLHKNLEIIPSVAASIAQRAPLLDFEFQLTLPSEDPKWLAIARNAEKLNVAKHIKTLKNLNLRQLAIAYNDCSAVFLPTLREVSTAVYPESFYFERPLVTSDMDFAHELCGDAALYCNPAKADNFAGALLQIAQSQSTAKMMIRKGTKQFKSRYPIASEKFQMQIKLLRKLAAKNGV